MEEASGTRYDFSRRGNHLTSNNSVGQGVGIQGNSATFVTASVQGLSSTSTDFRFGNTDFSLSCWLFSTNINNSDVITKWGGSGNYEYILYVSTKQATFSITSSGQAATIVTVTASNFGNLSSNTWYNVDAWHDSVADNIGIAVNGVTNLVATPLGVFSGTSVFEIGLNPTSSGTAFWGRIDEAGVWNRVLTSAERTRIYNIGLGTHSPWGHP